MVRSGMSKSREMSGTSGEGGLVPYQSGTETDNDGDTNIIIRESLKHKKLTQRTSLEARELRKQKENNYLCR